MYKFLGLFLVMCFTIIPTSATQQINYMAGTPVSVTYGNGYTRNINTFGYNAPPQQVIGYNHPRNYATIGVNPRQYARLNQRRYAMTRPVRQTYYGQQRPVVVNNNIVVDPAKEVKNTQPEVKITKPYTRSGITYYN